MCWKWRTITRISTTRVSVEGSSPSRRCSAGSASHSSARISAYNADFVGKCLNSSPSEIEAAAATLLVVVPAKPLRAKQRLAALKISCRRKSPVMRRVLMLVSKHSPYRLVKRFVAMQLDSVREPRWRLNRAKPERASDAVHDEGAVAAGEDALQIGAVDLDAGEARPAREVLQLGCEGLDLRHGGNGAYIRDPARLGDADEIDRARGVARLPAGFAIDLIVEHDDGEVCGFLQADGGETAHPHQHLAVAGDDDDRQLRLRQREAETDHDRAAHRAP